MAEQQEKGVSRAALLVVITAGIASLLEIVDTSIVNVAIPTMMGNLGATLDEIGWVVTGYIISNAIILPISGWLATRFGRRKYYITCILLFIAASVACGLAPNLWTLVLFRIIQGLAGGALLPTSQALIQEAFPGRSGIGSALYGMVVIIGPTIGPPLGGFLTDHFGWRMIFNINLPLGLLAAFLAGLYVTDYSEEGEHAAAHQKMRSAGGHHRLTLLIVGVGCLQYVLERGQADDWFSNKLVLFFTIVSAVCIPAFVWWELKTEHPIMDLRLFKSVALINGTIMMACVGGMLYGLIFFIPIFASTILGMNASQTGNLFTPGALRSGSDDAHHREPIAKKGSKAFHGLWNRLRRYRPFYAGPFFAPGHLLDPLLAAVDPGPGHGRGFHSRQRHGFGRVQRPGPGPGRGHVESVAAIGRQPRHRHPLHHVQQVHGHRL